MQPGFYGKSIADILAFDLEAARKREMVQRFARMGNKQVRALLKANQHQAAAAAGGSSREVARRARQIAAGKLKVST